MSVSNNKDDKYILELKLSDSEIKNIFGTTELAMFDCGDMTDEEINKIVDEFNSIGCTSFNYLSLTESERKNVGFDT